MNVDGHSLEPAYLIHTRAYGDTSLIIELMTPTHGRMSVLAKGVKKGKTQKALLLQPFRSLHVAWSGRGDLPYLRTVEEAGQMLHLRGEALACGYYMNELVYRLLPKHEPATDIFAHYWPTLDACQDSEIRAAKLRHFEMVLLEQVGLSPNLTQDISSGEDIVAEEKYIYKVPDGPTRANAASRHDVELTGESLLNIAAFDFSESATQKYAKRLTRALLHYHLDGRELNSRALFHNFKNIGQNIGKNTGKNVGTSKVEPES